MVPSVFRVLIFGAVLCAAGSAQARQSPEPPQQPAGAANPASAVSTTWSARNWTRVESWSFFEPRRGGGEPDYTFVANRLLGAVRHVRPRVEFNGAVQYVQFGGLPTSALGPGAFGTGALYYDAAQDTRSRQVYLKTLNVRLKPGGGVSVQLGRMPYASGQESPSGVAAIEDVKRQRLDSRMIGEFEWSLYQRAFDGVRADLDRGGWHLTGSFLMPTQGGFEEEANVTMTDVRVIALNAGIKPTVLGGHSDVQVFAYRYDDEREVRARPDNTGRAATAVDVAINTIGASLTAVYRIGAGEFDTLVWAAGQNGGWYGQDHRAFSVALEAGYRFTSAPWVPWVRGGVNYSSGDADPFDDTHGTFFPMLPTGRKYAFTASYAQMNLRDTFAQLMVRPHGRLTARVDFRRLDLAQAADRWYSGSGATARAGSFFGYSGRLSRGFTGLGTVIETAADVALTRRWSVNAYLGTIAGGDVVTANFAGDRLRFIYVENVLSF